MREGASSSACTGSGQSVIRSDPSLIDVPLLLRLCCRALLLGDTAQDGESYTVALSAEDMAALAAVIAPEAEKDAISFTEGSVRLDCSGGRAAALRIDCAGTTRIVRAEVPASISAQLRFSDNQSFPELTQALISALNLED